MQMKKNDCRLGKVNGERKCGSSEERRSCAAAIERKMPTLEGIMQAASMSYPVQEKKVEIAPIYGTSGFC